VHLIKKNRCFFFLLSARYNKFKKKLKETRTESTLNTLRDIRTELNHEAVLSSARSATFATTLVPYYFTLSNHEIKFELLANKYLLKNLGASLLIRPNIFYKKKIAMKFKGRLNLKAISASIY